MYRYQDLAKQLVLKQSIDPKTETEAVDKRKQDGNPYREKCMATARVKIDDSWGEKTTGESSASSGPQEHAERHAIGNAIKRSIIINTDEKSKYKYELNFDQGQVAAGSLNHAGVTDLDVYTELPPCWGCDPWLQGVETKLTGKITSRYSKFLDKYYTDYDKLKANNGTKALLGYHIGYVLDDLKHMRMAGKHLESTVKYLAPEWEKFSESKDQKDQQSSVDPPVDEKQVISDDSGFDFSDTFHEDEIKMLLRPFYIKVAPTLASKYKIGDIIIIKGDFYQITGKNQDHENHVTLYTKKLSL